jgi:hypothetical protein
MTIETRRASPMNNVVVVAATAYPEPPPAAGQELVAAADECILVRTKPGDEGGTMVRVVDAAALDDLPHVGTERWSGEIHGDGPLRVTDVLGSPILDWPLPVGQDVRLRVYSDHPLTPDDLVIVVG